MGLGDELTLLFQVGAGFLVVMFVLAPLVVWWRVRAAGEQAFEPADPQAFLGTGNPALRSSHAAVTGLGFEPVAATWFVNAEARAQVLIYRLAGDPALAMLFQQSPTASLVVTSFDQPFADGTRTTLTNSPFAAVFAPWDRVRGFRLAGAAPAEAWRHFVALRRQHTASPPLDLAPGQELADLEALHLDTLAWLRGLGRHAATADGRLRFCITDAYRVSWRMLWPMTTLLAWRDARHVRSLTREPMPT